MNITLTINFLPRKNLHCSFYCLILLLVHSHMIFQHRARCEAKTDFIEIHAVILKSQRNKYMCGDTFS